ncbi:MAG: ABC transporter [Acidimicrobiales bacterium]
MSSAEALSRLRAELGSADLSIDLPGVDNARRDRDELIFQIDDYLLPRLRRVDAPVLAVLGGSTGAGKSTIVNSLVGTEVTTAGVLRPTTRAPVLVCNPADEAWYLDPDGVLPGLARTSTEVAAGVAGIRITTSDALPAGLAILDAPDIDSVEVANHDLAAQLLGAADLWLFVTTAARYADAVPWEYLAMAQERSAALAVVINRIPDGHDGEVAEHFESMLADRGLESTAVFSVTEGELDNGRLGERIAPVREWLHRLAADAGARQELIRSTLDGALDSIPDRMARIRAALVEQGERIDALHAVATRRYAQALVDIDLELDRGTLLRGEVLDQWREFVGTGAMMSRLEAGVSRLRDGMRRILKSGPSPDEQAAGQLESNLLVVTRDAVDRAALDIVERWESRPEGAQILSEAPRGIDRAGHELAPRVEHELAAWEQHVLDLVRQQAGDKVTIARTLSTGINGVGVALMVAVFSQTGGITGGEAAVATGTAAVSQAVLTAVFGEQAVRDLAREARENLISRLNGLLDRDRKRFDDLVAMTDFDVERLDSTLSDLEASRR